MLILGMGSGTYARQCKSYFGDMNIEGVEIDEKNYGSFPANISICLRMWK